MRRTWRPSPIAARPTSRPTSCTPRRRWRKARGHLRRGARRGDDRQLLPPVRQGAARGPKAHRRRMSFALHDPRLRLLGRRAPHRQQLGRLRSRKSEEPAPALRAAGRAARAASAHDGAGRHRARPARAAAERARQPRSTACSTPTTTPTTRTASTTCAWSPTDEAARRRVVRRADARQRSSSASAIASCSRRAAAIRRSSTHDIRSAPAPSPNRRRRRAHRGRSRSCRSTARSTSLGFRFGGIAYSPDISGLPEARCRCSKGSMCGSWMRCATRRIRATFRSSRRSSGSSASSPSAPSSRT